MIRDVRDQLSQVVIHCFTGTQQALSTYLDMDLHIGITGWICDERRGVHLRELVQYIPSNRLMLETDAPYLLPRDMPKNRVKRTHRNEPSYLRHIAERVADYRNCDSDTLCQETARTSAQFFNLC